MADAGRRRRGPPSPAPPLENDDLLTDILLRLPPTPSSLPRASLVCKRWRRLVADRAFLRRFRARHRRAAPLLGFFANVPRAPAFTPTLDGPDRLPPGRLSPPLVDDDGCRVLGCRHGLVLIYKPARGELLVWESGAGDPSRVPVAPGFIVVPVQNGAVLRAAGDGDGDGEDHSIPPFLVVLVGTRGARAFACVYSSEAGEWGDLISAACPSVYAMHTPSALIGGSLYWLLGGITPGILELDLDQRRLALIPMPANISSVNYFRHWVVPGEGGELGFLCLSGFSVTELWTRKRDRGDAAQWVLRRTIDLAKLLSLSSSEDGFPPMIFGFAEEDRVSFLATHRGICMVQLESMQFKRSIDISKLDIYHPFASVYTAGLGTGGGQDGPEPVHNA